jgi:transposase-like protein
METPTVNGRVSRSSKTNRKLEITERPKRRRFPIAEKRRIVAAADARAPGTLGALLRREGIYSSLLATWRKQRDRGQFDAVVLRQHSTQKSFTHSTGRGGDVGATSLVNCRLSRETLVCQSKSDRHTNSLVATVARTQSSRCAATANRLT